MRLSTQEQQRFTQGFARRMGPIPGAREEQALYGAVAAELLRAALPGLAAEVAAFRTEAGSHRYIEGFRLGHISKELPERGYFPLEGSSRLKPHAEVDLPHALALATVHLLGANLPNHSRQPGARSIYFMNSMTPPAGDRTEFDKEFTEYPHTHDQFTILIGLHANEGVRTRLMTETGDVDVALKRGDMLLFSPGVLHDRIITHDAPEKLRAAATYFCAGRKTARDIPETELDAARQRYLLGHDRPR